MSVFGEPTVGQSYRINFTDTDGNALSTADGHITSVVLISNANVDKAYTVGDRNPDFCLGDPTCRMITVVAFETKHSKLARALFTSFMRRRVDSESKRLQTRSDRLQIVRNARQDVSPSPISKPRLQRSSIQSRVAALFHVFVFGRKMANSSSSGAMFQTRKSRPPLQNEINTAARPNRSRPTIWQFRPPD